MLTPILAILNIVNLVYAILTPRDDPYSFPKYSLRFLSPQNFEQQVALNKTLLDRGNITNFGSDYKCYISDASLLSRQQQQQANETELKLKMQRDLSQGVEIISHQLAEKCIYLPDGYWNYRFCNGKNFTQYHAERKSVVLAFKLGSSGEDNRQNIQLLYDDFGYYISEIIDSGDICMETGYPRVIEVQYVCDTSANGIYMNWVKEIKTCQYQAQVSIPGLCNVELLLEKEKEIVSNVILCARNEEEKPIQNSMLFFGKYQPHFVGYGFYFLIPDALQNSTASTAKTLLVYTDKLDTSQQDSFSTPSEDPFFGRVGKAFRNIITQGIIKAPGGGPYRTGDSFVWFTEVFNTSGDLLSVLKAEMDSESVVTFTFGEAEMMANLNEGNFYQYTLLEEKKIMESANHEQLSNQEMKGVSQKMGELTEESNNKIIVGSIDQDEKIKRLFGELSELIGGRMGNELGIAPEDDIALEIEVVGIDGVQHLVQGHRQQNVEVVIPHDEL